MEKEAPLNQQEECGCRTVSIKGLSVAYDCKSVLTDVSLEIEAGQVTAIIGPSGCGKSSLLKALNRIGDMIPGFHAEGSVQIGGQEIYGQSNLDMIDLRKRVGMIFQKPSPFPLSIKKNVQLALREHGVRQRSELDQRTEKVLNDVGLWSEVKDRLNDSALNLSGGQQQRLCIARALALNPEVLLFDEPCSALDPVSSRRVEDLIASISSQTTVLIVTHNLAQAQRIADHVAMFWFENGMGKLIESGPADQVFENAKDPITAAYLQGKEG